MLNNRILVIGLERRYLEYISQMKSHFIFLHLENPGKYNPRVHTSEGLIFEGQLLLEMGDIIQNFKSKPVFGIGKGPALDDIRWIGTLPKVEVLEDLLTSSLGDLRAPPRDTGNIEIGTVVKNKTFSSWGIGVVIKELEDDLLLVKFPHCLKTLKKDEHVCHKSTLRIICSIKELSNENVE